jgi:hypothetical protein
MRTARYAGPSVAQPFDDEVDFGGDLLPQRQRRYPRIGRLCIVPEGDTALAEPLAKPLQEHVAARLGDVENPSFVEPRVRVHIFTIIDGVVTFFVILYVTRRWGWKVSLHSAVIGTAAAWTILEFPFDLIVMMRINPPIPNHTMVYRLLFFLPLFLVEFSTVSLLTLLPSMRVTAYAAYAVAGMFAVFAVWAAFGFAFPTEPLPLAFNVTSKILCFVGAVMLFVWRVDRPEAA